MINGSNRLPKESTIEIGQKHNWPGEPILYTTNTHIQLI